MIELTAETVLNMRFISYTTPLELAYRWARSDEPAERGQALTLLKGLFERFPHSIEIGQQLALAHLETGNEREAESVLQDLRLLCRSPHEEVLCRCGRVFRDRGDHYVAYPPLPGTPELSFGGPTEIPAEAERYYLLAWEEYNKAYQIRFGNYPGVNVATLHLLIAAFTSDADRRETHRARSRDVAESLLARRSHWPREGEEDAIWHAASAGEIHLLLQQWQSAKEHYAESRQHDRFQMFHRNSILKQVVRILYAHQRLGVNDFAPFGNLAEIFPP